MYDISLFLFGILLLYGAICDVKTFEIPNFVSVGGGLLFVPAALGEHLGPLEVFSHLSAAGVVLVLGFVLFVKNIFGGGDAKLLSVAALWCGFSGLLPLLFWVSTVGGVISLILIAFRMSRMPVRYQSIGWLSQLHGEKGIPYGVAISFGSLAVLIGNLPGK